MSVTRQGTVYLVGAGPGDPGLITLRGMECLQEADVVIYDRLINCYLLNYAPHAELICVGKQPGYHPVPQEEINALLVEQAQAGKVVVRLKGGDPFVFGRGGEEAQFLAEAGVPFEIVPGVTSAIAVPAYAGIPITRRDWAQNAAFVSGHGSGCSGQAGGYPGGAACDCDTLVFLMGVSNLSQIVEDLTANGRAPETPIAVIENGSTATQRTIDGTLADIVQRVADVHPPAIIVVGEVVRLRETLRWFDLPERRPMHGIRVLNTRPKVRESGDKSYRSDVFSRQLAALGADVVALPTKQIVPTPNPGLLDQAIHRLATRQANRPAYDWVLFTSANAVMYFINRLFALGYDMRSLAGTKIGAVGSSTAEALRAEGIVADFIPSRYASHALGTEIEDISGKRVLLPRSDAATSDLVDVLQRRGARVDAVDAYSLQPADVERASLAMLLEGNIDVAVFFSPSALKGLAEILDDAGRSQKDAPTLADALSAPIIACIGPATAKAARALGVRVDLVAEEHSVEGMCVALRRHYTAKLSRGGDDVSW